MSVKKSTPVRRRRTSEDARAEALAAARRLLLEKGPAALTLKAVANEVGVTHANLLHHFGSAGGLQTELMTMMIRDLTDALGSAVEKLRAGEATLDQLIGLTFEAFGAGGAGHLAAWMVLNREAEHLEPIGEAVRGLAQALTIPGKPSPEKAILLGTMLAFAEAVIGPHLRAMLDEDENAAQDLAARLLPVVLLDEQG